MRKSLAPSADSALLTTKEVAAFLRLHPTTLRIARSKKTLALPYVHVGGAIRYRRVDVDAFIAANMGGSC